MCTWVYVRTRQVLHRLWPFKISIFSILHDYIHKFLWMINHMNDLFRHDVTSTPLAPAPPRCNRDTGQLHPSAPPPSQGTSDQSENITIQKCIGNLCNEGTIITPPLYHARNISIAGNVSHISVFGVGVDLLWQWLKGWDVGVLFRVDHGHLDHHHSHSEQKDDQ